MKPFFLYLLNLEPSVLKTSLGLARWLSWHGPVAASSHSYWAHPQGAHLAGSLRLPQGHSDSKKVQPQEGLPSQSSSALPLQSFGCAE